MTNSSLLKLTSKEKDNIVCEVCSKGIFVPDHPQSEINHSFHCNVCGAKISIEKNIVVE